MAYLKPPWLTRVIFNRLAMRSGLSGTQRLTVAGRRSGAERAVPVIPVEIGGTSYVVSTRGESEWVRNVRRAGEVRLHHKSGSERLVATEIPLAERPPIIEAYRAKAGRTVAGYWKKLPEPADHPVFRLDQG